jgi:CBS domain-containing protein
MIVDATVSALLQEKPKQIWSVAPEATVFEAIELMAQKNVGALPVLSGGRLLGIISERDYTRKVALRGKSSRETPVKEITTNEPIVASPNHTVEECMRLMTEHRVRHLPVLQGDELVGIISIGDLVNWIISAQNAALDQMQSYISGGYVE